MQILSGVYAAKTLAAAVELDLFSKISGRGTTFEEAGEILALKPRPAEMLLSGCASLGLLKRRKGRFYNSALAEKFLVRGKDEYFGDMVRMVDQRAYLPWLHVTTALKTDRALTWGDHPGLFEALSANPDSQRLFTEAMHSVSVNSGRAMAEAFDFAPYRRLLDIGGGSGAYCIEAARRHPHLKAAVFDIAPALEIANEKIAQAGLSDRVETIPGDFFGEDLPRDADVALLSMILHDWGPEKNLGILRKAYEALPAGGVVIVSELMMDDDKTGPASAALMSLTMLIEAEGRNYTWSEYTEWLEQVGFRNIERIPIQSPGANGLLIGHKPR